MNQNVYLEAENYSIAWIPRILYKFEVGVFENTLRHYHDAERLCKSCDYKAPLFDV